jgi:hypothetical protein
VLADLEVVVAEELRGLAGLDVVELVDEQHVRVGALDDLGDGLRLDVVVGAEVADEVALGVAVEGGVEGREPDTLVRVALEANSRQRNLQDSVCRSLTLALSAYRARLGP